MTERPHRVLYFGTYSMGEGYPRNRVLIQSLRAAGVEVAEVHEEFWSGAEMKIAGAVGGRARFAMAAGYAAAWARLAARYLKAGRHDAVVVGYTGQLDVFLARALAALTGRPVVLDAFLSLEDTLVNDRRLVRPGGPFARLLRLLDAASSRAADLVLLDTAAHARWFVRATRLPPSRFAELFVGEDEAAFPPVPPPPRSPGAPLRVLWFGSYVPLQGAGTIVKAAEALDGRATIRMIGRGQEFPEVEALAAGVPQVELVPRWLSYAELSREIGAADVCLGIFGTSGKASRVIPCKVYDALSVGRAVVTADTPAARELLADGESALLVPAGDPAALAAALRRLAADDSLRERIARRGREVFAERAAALPLGRRFRGLLEELHRRRRSSA